MAGTATQKTRKSWAGRLVTLGLLALFVAGLIGAVLATGWDESVAALSLLSLWHLLALLSFSVVNYVLRTVRWHIMARAAGLKLSLTQNFRHYIAGFAMTATPGRLGELVRLRWITRETGVSFDKLAPLALGDRAAELAGVAPLILISIAVTSVGSDVALPLAVTALAGAVIVTRPGVMRWLVTLGWRMTGRLPRLFARLRRAVAGLADFTPTRVALPAVLLGALGWLAEGAALWYLLDWLNAPIGFWLAVGIFLIAILAGSAAGLPGGLGGAEAAMVALLILQDVPLSVAVAATAIIRLTTLWFAIALGVAVFPYAERASKKQVNTN